MTGFEILVIGGVSIAVLDFVLGMIFARCVIPGLKCRACRDC